MKIGITERGDGGLDQSWRKQMQNVDGAIIITKAPQLLIDTDIPSNTIIHCTITGWGGTIIEPNVEKPSITIAAWRRLKTDLGRERVVLRIDPIIVENPKPALHMAAMTEQGDRIRVSFMDNYPHVKARFASKNIQINQSFHAPLTERKHIMELLPPQTEVCAEPGFKCTGCISQRDLNAMEITQTSKGKCTQRYECNCIAEKTELLRNRHPCNHECLYCYWK